MDVNGQVQLCVFVSGCSLSEQNVILYTFREYSTTEKIKQLVSIFICMLYCTCIIVNCKICSQGMISRIDVRMRIGHRFSVFLLFPSQGCLQYTPPKCFEKSKLVRCDLLFRPGLFKGWITLSTG